VRNLLRRIGLITAPAPLAPVHAGD
jgi:hypothetical protein